MCHSPFDVVACLLTSCCSFVLVLLFCSFTPAVCTIYTIHWIIYRDIRIFFGSSSLIPLAYSFLLLSFCALPLLTVLFPQMPFIVLLSTFALFPGCIVLTIVFLFFFDRLPVCSLLLDAAELSWCVFLLLDFGHSRFTQLKTCYLWSSERVLIFLDGQLKTCYLWSSEKVYLFCPLPLVSCCHLQSLHEAAGLLPMSPSKSDQHLLFWLCLLPWCLNRLGFVNEYFSTVGAAKQAAPLFPPVFYLNFASSSFVRYFFTATPKIRCGSPEFNYNNNNSERKVVAHPLPRPTTYGVVVDHASASVSSENESGIHKSGYEAPNLRVLSQFFQPFCYVFGYACSHVVGAHQGID